MARQADLERRRELLDALVTEVAVRGIGGRSLRDLAGAVGTSHRMLLHHFVSRDELLVAIVGEVERRQRALMRELPAAPADAIEAMWANLRRPDLRSFERLFFECYARGVQGEQPFARMLPGAVDDWLSEQPNRAPAMMRLGLAVVRGLLLDLVATEDLDGIDAAITAFADLVRAADRAR
ncbi:MULTISPECIES: TetR/AcrR family transcriptional regulator [unclassified Mycobacterium]|uniref:TetR/AcrR family transcriptional regulator n=1 Tax=unclassified Mycobacterium TaxID=2642494 RepID=UPI00073FBA20|nr:MULTISPECIES: TetR/AcrR family transcriptional regulator [unclassified Mycobacterium]KUH82976.1 TetR family transcriptional regulator [Mycobacterium sp. IS-1556]KUH83245.1 TetR family transcriptional regulator [Mycobacterium sp. GA-0227b]KUH84345.1 TetR family transcriptional regulator [Mycobacterium sp. GA-1999]